jgi:hypothetical protein
LEDLVGDQLAWMAVVGSKVASGKGSKRSLGKVAIFLRVRSSNVEGRMELDVLEKLFIALGRDKAAYKKEKKRNPQHRLTLIQGIRDK